MTADWQTVDSAPKDGTEILAYWSKSNTYGVISWCDDKDDETWMDDVGAISAPTHWMPLPEPPK